MKLLIVILAIGLLVLAYFWMGVALKFLLLWWMSFVVGIPLLYIGLTFGWLGAIGAVLGAVLLLAITLSWQNSHTCQVLQARLNKAFYFDDI